MTDTLEVGVPAERVTPLRPSEALRLGRLLRPRRIEGSMTDGEDGACALGSILAVTPPDIVVPPELNERAPCPISNCRINDYKHWDVFAITHHLNDQHHWSDDQIVTWLESLGL